MIVFLCAHVGISISTYTLTSIVTYLPYMHPLCKILNMPVMSICLVKQNDGMWVVKHQRFLFNVYKRFFIFFSGTFFFTSMHKMRERETVWALVGIPKFFGTLGPASSYGRPCLIP